MEHIHVPVMVREVCEVLDVGSGGYFVDCTLGLGGHAEAFLKSSAGTSVLGLDRDLTALEMARKRLAPFGDRFSGIHCNFKDTVKWSGELERPPKGILLDLGISSLQLVKGRGFSFRDGDSLDMRMDRSCGVTAAELVATATKEELSSILRSYGEVDGANRVAKAITEARREREITTAKELGEIVAAAVPKKPGGDRINPATKVFQALRIAVNGELEGLGDFLKEAVSLLAASGRIAVISYHSLEDRIVKNVFRDLLKGCICPPKLPACGCGIRPSLSEVSRSPVRPGMDEVLSNPSSRSAKMRCAVKA